MRINNYSKLLSELLGCDERSVEEISKFAQLHDIGKINVANRFEAVNNLISPK